jgi:hypothetical protein
LIKLTTIIGAPVTPVTVTKVTTVVTSVTAAVIRMTSALMIPVVLAVTRAMILGKIPQVVTQDMVTVIAAVVTLVTVTKVVTVTSVTIVTAIVMVVKKKTIRRNPPYLVWNL